MNHSSADTPGEAPIGSPILGPAVPPRSADAEPRRTVIDWASGPFFGRERAMDGEPARPHAERDPAADEDVTPGEDLPWLSYPGEDELAHAGSHDDVEESRPSAEDIGAATIESGVLGGGEVVPIESLAPGSGAVTASEPQVLDVESEDRSAEPWAEGGERPEEEREEEHSADPWGETLEGRADQEAEDPYLARQAASEEAVAVGPSGDEQELPAYPGGWAEVGDEGQSAVEMSEDAPEERPAEETAAFGDDPYWEPWSEPGEEESAVEGASGSEAGAVPLTGLEIPGASSAVLREIAERLERIARSLRARESGDLAGDASDPLEVLITGYALGFSDGARSAGTGRHDVD
jgi:hypothetical protein